MTTQTYEKIIHILAYEDTRVSIFETSEACEDAASKIVREAWKKWEGERPFPLEEGLAYDILAHNHDGFTGFSVHTKTITGTVVIEGCASTNSIQNIELIKDLLNFIESDQYPEVLENLRHRVRNHIAEIERKTTISESLVAIKEAFDQISEELSVKKPCPDMLKEAFKNGLENLDNVDQSLDDIADMIF